MLFHIFIGNTFDLSNTHLPAGLCDRVFCLGILSEKEKKLYPAIQKDTRFPLSFKLDPDPEYCVFDHPDNQIECSCMNG